MAQTEYSGLSEFYLGVMEVAANAAAEGAHFNAAYFVKVAQASARQESQAKADADALAQWETDGGA